MAAVRRRDGSSWFHCPADLLHPVRSLDAADLPDGDAIVASSWRTAAQVAAASPRSGTPYYFIQHYETWDGSEQEVDATWRLAMHRIVVSSWLASIAARLEARFGDLVVTLELPP